MTEELDRGIRSECLITFKEQLKLSDIVHIHFINRDMLIVLPSCLENVIEHGNFTKGLEITRETNFWRIAPVFTRVSADGIIESSLSGSDDDWVNYGDAPVVNGKKVLRHGILAMKLTSFSRDLQFQYDVTGTRIEIGRYGQERLGLWTKDRFGSNVLKIQVNL